MGILLTLIYIVLFCFAIYKLRFFTNTGLSTKLLCGVFFVKILSSFVLYWIYTRYYPVRMEADIFKYFDDSTVIFSSLKHSITDYLKIVTGIDSQNSALDVYYDQMNFWFKKFDYGLFNDNRTIIRANAIIMLFSFGNIFVHNVFASFISLMSYVLLYKVFSWGLQKVNYAIFIAILLIPSSIFWTSAMLKETILMIGVSGFVYAIHSLSYKRISLKYISYLLISLLFLMSIKIYVIICILPAGVAYFMVARLPRIKPYLIYSGMFLLCIFALVFNETIIHFVPFLDTLASKRNDFIMDAAYYAHAQSYMPIGFIDSNVLAFFKDTPLSMYRALFLPVIWSVNSFVEILPALENLLFFVLAFLSIFYFKKPQVHATNLILFSIFFSVVLMWIIGVSTPVIGAIVRYKVPIFPFLYSIFALIIDWKKLFTKVNDGKYSI